MIPRLKSIVMSAFTVITVVLIWNKDVIFVYIDYIKDEAIKKKNIFHMSPAEGALPSKMKGN